MPPPQEDKDIDISTAFDWNDAFEQRACLLAMQKELKKAA
jgi:hypothetical protein